MTIVKNKFLNLINKINNFLSHGNNFLMVFSIFTVIGLLKIITVISIIPINFFYENIDSWAQYFYNPDKPLEFLRYIVACLLIASYLVALLYLLKRKYILFFLKHKSYKPIIVISVIALINILLFGYIISPIHIHNLAKYLMYFAINTLIWIISFCAPFYRSIDKYINEKHVVSRIQKIYYILFFIVIIQFLFIFEPFVFGKLKLINEYWDIPEQTYLVDTYVDNVNYINEHNLLGLHHKYDIRNPNQIYSDQNCIKFNYDANLEQFLKTANNSVFIYTYIARLNIDKNKFPTKIDTFFFENDKKFVLPVYYYENNQHKLCVIGQVLNSDVAKLSNLANYSIENNLYDITYASLGPANLSTEEHMFIKNNEFESHWQVYNRYFIHHQNHVLGPINEINLGKDPHASYMQYGYLNTIMLKDVLNAFGGINLQNYVKLSYSFYYIYYILFFILLFVLFRDLRYILPIILLVAISYNRVGYDFISIAPGNIPLRHFFDIFVLFFLYLYVFKDKKIYLFFLFAFGLIGIANGNQFGLFAFWSSITTVLVHQYRTQKVKNITLLLISSLILLLLGGLVYHFTDIGIHTIDKYFAEGLLGLSYPDFAIAAILILIITGYFFVIRAICRKNNMGYIALFLLLYSQGLLLYYIWCSDLMHFLAVVPMLAITVFAIFKSNYNNGKYKNEILYIATIGALFIYIPTVFYFYYSKFRVDDIFRTHKTYEWNLPTAKFTSTMNPDYFLDSINLIKTYSEKPEIYIISKYDNFLPFLSGKYSAMPYFDIPWYAMSYKELRNSIHAIQTSEPRYIFVDTDIERPYELDAVSLDTKVSEDYIESILRVKRLNATIKNIFNAVKKDYHPIEKGLLITVYERNNE